MDGIQFLSIVRERWPESVRAMLTGNADMGTAISAVNEGNVFRFITKPCPADILINIIGSCLAQYHLILAERELLENTLKGSIKVLVDILGLTNPMAFSRAMRVKDYVVQVADLLNLADRWRYEVAAMLSQIGYVTVPPETLEKSLVGEDLSESEQEMMGRQSEVAKNFIAKIPRLELVSEMIASQDRPFDELKESSNKPDDDPALMGAALLKAGMDFDTLLVSGATPHDALETLGKKAGSYNPSVLAALKEVDVPTFEKTIRLLKIRDLRNGMVLAEEVRTREDVLVVTKGQEVNDVLRQRLENFSLKGSIEPSVRVYVPAHML